MGKYKKDDKDIYDIIINTKLKRIEGLSDEFNNLVFSMLNKNINKRADWNFILNHSWFNILGSFKNIININNNNIDNQSLLSRSKSPIKYAKSLRKNNYIKN